MNLKHVLYSPPALLRDNFHLKWGHSLLTFLFMAISLLGLIISTVWKLPLLSGFLSSKGFLASGASNISLSVFRLLFLATQLGRGFSTECASKKWRLNSMPPWYSLLLQHGCGHRIRSFWSFCLM